MDLVLAWFVRISYVGNRGYHLSEAITRDLNPAVYNGAASTTGNTNARRTNPLFAGIAPLQSSSNDLGWSSPYSPTLDYGPSVGT